LAPVTPVFKDWCPQLDRTIGGYLAMSARFPLRLQGEIGIALLSHIFPGSNTRQEELECRDRPCFVWPSCLRLRVRRRPEPPGTSSQLPGGPRRREAQPCCGCAGGDTRSGKRPRRPPLSLAPAAAHTTLLVTAGNAHASQRQAT